MFAELHAITAGGNVSAPGLAVVSSDYQSSVNGEQAHVQSITSGGVQPMADTQGGGILTHADGYASVNYDFRVVGPSVDANGNVVRVPVILDRHFRGV